MARKSWLDEQTQQPLIEDYTRKLGTFVEAMADGRIDDEEIAAQEARLVSLMKEVEPTLDDAQHEAVTRLLCEMTAYNLMQLLNSIGQARPKSQFRG